MHSTITGKDKTAHTDSLVSFLFGALQGFLDVSEGTSEMREQQVGADGDLTRVRIDSIV